MARACNYPRLIDEHTALSVPTQKVRVARIRLLPASRGAQLFLIVALIVFTSAVCLPAGGK